MTYDPEIDNPIFGHRNPERGARARELGFGLGDYGKDDSLFNDLEMGGGVAAPPVAPMPEDVMGAGLPIGTDPGMIPMAPPLPPMPTSPAQVQQLGEQMAPSSPGPDVEQYLNALRKDVEFTSNPLAGFFRGLQGRDPMESRKALAGTAMDVQKMGLAQQKMKMGAFQEAINAMHSLAKIEDPDIQKAMAPHTQNLVKNIFDTIGVKYDMETFPDIFSSPGFAGTMAQLLEDPVYGQARDKILAAAQKQPRSQRAKFVEDQRQLVLAQKSADLKKELIPLAKQIRQEQGLAPDTLIPAAPIIEALRKMGPQSPGWGLIVDSLTEGKEGEDAMTNAGVISPSVARKQAEGGAKDDPDLQAAKYFNQYMPQGVTQHLPTAAAEITKGPMPSMSALKTMQLTQPLMFGDIYTLAQVKALDWEKQKIAGGIITKTETQLDLPWGASQWHLQDGKELIERATGNNVTQDPSWTGRKVFTVNSPVVAMDKKDWAAFQSLRGFEVIMAHADKAAQALATIPGQNFRTGVHEVIQNFMGVSNSKTFLEKMKPAMFTIARDLEGSGRLSDQDVKMIEAGFFSVFDTQDQAVIGLRLMKALFDTRKSMLLKMPAMSKDELQGMVEATFRSTVEKPKSRFDKPVRTR